MRASKWLWGALGAAVVAGAALAGCRVQSQSDNAQPSAVSAPPPPSRVAVAALGRLEPRHGLIHVAGPSSASVVIAKLLVEEGDQVKEGQVLAVLDTFALHEASVARLEAELSDRKLEFDRTARLHREHVVAVSRRDSLQLKVRMVEADLRRVRAERDLARVRAPIVGQVIKIHAREGERVGPQGVLELGRTNEMFAIAEVYETDIGKVKVGQRAVVTSPALPGPLEGTVEWINLKVGKLDVLGADPAAKTDARVVEVEVRLAESEVAAGLTNLQVEVEFEP